MKEVVGIEVLEDLTARSRCDEGFLHVKRLRARNRYADGSTSREYRVDVVDRPIPDAVAVLVWRRGPAGLEVLTRKTLRPAAHFRAGLPLPLPDPRGYLFVEELVAGVLEPSDHGDPGLLRRAAEEVLEEAGFRVAPGAIRRLGSRKGPPSAGGPPRRCSRPAGPGRWRTPRPRSACGASSNRPRGRSDPEHAR